MTALLAALLIAALLTIVLWALSAPFRRPRRTPRPAADSDARRALESAKEAKYAEIRDNETDYRTGKLSEEDFRALDRQLRAEAVEILRAIDELVARTSSGSG
jgi:flagellar biosynthesis/type III secretory pathway M-ring protein FliF/YscJ